MPQYILDIWQYLKDNDAPNWFVIVISLFVWPVALSAFFYWWNNRTKQSVPDFKVTFTPTTRITIDGLDYDAVQLNFINQTGSIVYLHHGRLREVRKNFPIPSAASRNMADGKRELIFARSPTPPNQNVRFDLYECILQTNEIVHAALATNQIMDDKFYSYRPRLLRRWLRLPKYFLLEYVVVVGEKKFSVATVY
jgi:hypothetical protein